MSGNILASPIHAPLGSIFGGNKHAPRAVPMAGVPADTAAPVANPDGRRAGVTGPTTGVNAV